MKKRLPNPSVEYFKTKILREQEIEKICREICDKVYKIDPDLLVSKMIPQTISNMDRFNIAWIIPEKQWQIPAWMLFKEEAEIVWHHIALNGKAFTGFKK